MKDSKVYDCTIIELDRHHTPQGNLSVVTNSREVPFDVKRVYYSYDIPGGKARGAHAHRRLYQLLVAASGAFSVTMHLASSMALAIVLPGPTHRARHLAHARRVLIGSRLPLPRLRGLRPARLHTRLPTVLRLQAWRVT